MNEENYKKGLMVFSSDGEVQEVQKAKEGVKRSLPSIGVTYRDGVVLASCTERDKSVLLREDNLSSVFMISDRVGMVSSGRVADSQALADDMRDKAMEDIEMYGKVEDVNLLAREVSEDVREATQTLVNRPYGVSLLVGGLNGNEKSSLFKISVDGSMSSWDACAIGENSEDMIDHMESRYNRTQDRDDALQLALTTILSFSDADSQSLSVSLVAESGFEEMNKSEVDELITEVINNE